MSPLPPPSWVLWRGCCEGRADGAARRPAGSGAGGRAPTAWFCRLVPRISRLWRLGRPNPPPPRFELGRGKLGAVLEVPKNVRSVSPEAAPGSGTLSARLGLLRAGGGENVNKQCREQHIKACSRNRGTRCCARDSNSEHCPFAIALYLVLGTRFASHAEARGPTQGGGAHSPDKCWT